ncbi:MAG: DNA-binding protein [Woeseiaceae bacterium]
MKSIVSLLTITVLVTGMLLTGCTKSADEPVAGNVVTDTPVPAGMVRGTVLETMNSGGYTYVFIDTAQDQRWVATRETTVQVGDVIQTTPGMPMQGFTSNTLNRTFNVVYFVESLQNLSAPAGPHPAAQKPPETSGEAAAVDVNVEALEPGKNIAYVYANKEALAGQQVSLRGNVVKYNSNILGWNFIHIRDGSGDAADGSNDLTVTSKAETAIGDTVIAAGTIILDKDFDAGYKFPVLMEDAVLTIE